MTKTTKLNWRLKELPTAEGVANLVAQKVITVDEARELLLTEKDKVVIEDSTKMKALQDEVKFLRETVDKLASTRTDGYKIVYHEWQRYTPTYEPWYRQYEILCQAPSGISTTSLNLLSSNLS